MIESILKNSVMETPINMPLIMRWKPYWCKMCKHNELMYFLEVS